MGKRQLRPLKRKLKYKGSRLKKRSSTVEVVYVDPVRGSDRNSGRLASKSKRTFVTPPDSVALVRFRDRETALAVEKSKRRYSRRRLRTWQFTVDVSFRGLPDRMLERQLVKIARGESIGSGYDFVDCRRDVSFGFVRRTQAVAAAKRIKKAKLPRIGLKVSVIGRVWP